MKHIKRISIAAIVLLAVFLSSCDIVDGELPGNSVDAGLIYLEASDGTRYYSGDSIYLGYLLGGNSDIITNLTLVNDTESAISFTGSPVFEVIYDEERSQGGYLQVYPINYTTLDDGVRLTHAIQVGTAIATQEKSSSITFTLNTDTFTTAMITRRYKVMLEQDGEPLGFTFEVSGIIASSGW